MRVLNAGIDLMEFRPSVIASAVAICVTQETQTGEFTDKAFAFLTHQVDKVKLPQPHVSRFLISLNFWKLFVYLLD